MKGILDFAFEGYFVGAVSKNQEVTLQAILCVMKFMSSVSTIGLTSDERLIERSVVTPKFDGFSIWDELQKLITSIQRPAPIAIARSLLQRKAPLTTILIIPPPMRHTNNLPTPKEEEINSILKLNPHQMLPPRYNYTSPTNYIYT